ncbi:MAG: hypothetical protein GY778_00690 [bacterium]|nr:hypothetical protein [bacterium]
MIAVHATRLWLVVLAGLVGSAGATGPVVQADRVRRAEERAAERAADRAADAPGGDQRNQTDHEDAAFLVPLEPAWDRAVKSAAPGSPVRPLIAVTRTGTTRRHPARAQIARDAPAALATLILDSGLDGHRPHAPPQA